MVLSWLNKNSAITCTKADVILTEMKNFLIKTVLCGLWMGHLATQVSQPRGNKPSKANKMLMPGG